MAGLWLGLLGMLAAPGILAAQSVDIWVLEQPESENPDPYIEKNLVEIRGAWGIEPIRATSKREMLTKVLTALKPGECIRTLYFVAHGGPGQISMGSGTGSFPSQYFNGNTDEWAPLMAILKPRFCNDTSQLVLHGCNVGAREFGSNKLRELADALGVIVRAPIDAVYGGRIGEYRRSGRWQEAWPGRRAPDPVEEAEPGTPKRNRADIGGVVLETRSFETSHGRVVVHLPGGLAAGDRLTVTVAVEPSGDTEQGKARNAASLQGYVVEVEGERRPATNGGLGATLAVTAEVLTIALIDSRGRSVEEVEVPVEPPRVHIVPDVIEPGHFVPPAIGQEGQPVGIKGPFDGDAGTTEVAVGEEPARVLAERPGLVVVESPAGVTGKTTITVREQGVEVEAPYTNLGIDLSIARETLQRGTRETVVGTVKGLDGLPPEAFPLPYVLTNRTPHVVTFADTGPVVQGSIAGNSVAADGTYRFTQPLEAVRVGGFNVSATIGGPGWPPPPINKDCLTVLAAIEAWKDDDIGVRSDASDAAGAAFDRERERVRQQVLDELGPLAFAVFALDVEPEGVIYEHELQDESCIYQALRQAARSDDPETRARAEEILSRGQ